MARNDNLTIKKAFFAMACLCLLLTFLFAQDNQVSYLSQKLLVENSLRERISDALNKLLDDMKFVVDVNVDIEFTPIEQTQTVRQSPSDARSGETVAKGKPKTSARSVQTPADMSATSKKPAKQTYSLPLPGFEIPQEAFTETPRNQPAQELMSDTAENIGDTSESQETPESKMVPTTVNKQFIPVLTIKRQQISIIVEDGVTPDMIENIRQVVNIASHFDRSRGDIISVMTANFKKKKETDGAQAIILKNIAEKIDDIDRRQTETERSGRIDQQRRAEKQVVVRDSLRMEDLKKEITDLRAQLQTPQLTDEQRQETEKATTVREQELANLKDQLRDSNRRLQEIELGALETTPPIMSRLKNMGVLIAAGIAALLILILLFIILITRRNQARRQEIEWGYGTKIPMGPRPVPPAPQPIEKPAPEIVAAPTSSQPAAVPPAIPVPEPKVAAEPVDMEAQKEEMKGIKQSVISMSVGQPDTASRIINDWLSGDVKPEQTEAE
ncbi:MAG: flagellar M-ring protein FliF C-terminal domain-containing protein [Candidatus Neomarinimicrobiota bacterium]